MNSVFLLSFPGTGEWIFVLVMILIAMLCLVDIIRSEFPFFITKLAWAAMVICVPFIGPLLYYWIGTEQKATSRG